MSQSSKLKVDTALRRGKGKKSAADPGRTPAERRADSAGNDGRTPRPQDYPWHRLSPKKGYSVKEEPIDIAGPSSPPAPQKFDWIAVVLQPLGALLAIVALFVILHMTGKDLSMGLYMLIGGVTGVLGILWGVLRYRKQKKEGLEKLSLDKSQYAAYLREKEQEIIRGVEDQLRAMDAETPSVFRCSRYTAESPELWSNGFQSRAFLKLRVGLGTVDFGRKITVPVRRYDEQSELAEEARALARRYEKMENAPVSLNLRESGAVGLAGSRGLVLKQAQSLIVALVALHSYEDVKLLVACPGSERGLWEELRFLLHVFDAQRRRRFLADNRRDATALFQYLIEQKKRREAESDRAFYASKSWSRPHLVLVAADMSYFEGSSLLNQLAQRNPAASISCVFLAETPEQLPGFCQTIVELQDEDHALLYPLEARDKAVSYAPDLLQEEAWGRFLRRISPVRLENPSAGVGIPERVLWREAGEFRTGSEVLKSWRESHPEESMAVRLGMMRDNQPFSFDIHPAKSGAHGIFVGTNGSGKSSIVRSWILAMASKFSPERVSFVLIDFKGSGLIHGLERLPHIAGTISNLDRDIRRNLTALRSEIAYRELLFQKNGVIDYYGYLDKLYAKDRSARPEAPFLFIVVDELNEFKMWCSDDTGADGGMKLLEKLYQTGRALGIHILAGSQSSEPFTAVMEKNARFRWCLKTATPDDSTFLLKSDDAFRITVRGRAIVRVGDNEVYEEVQPVFSDGPYESEEERRAEPEREMALLSLNGQRRRIQKDSGHRRSELDVAVDELAALAQDAGILPARKIWPPQLPEKLLLKDVPGLRAEPFTATVGLVDDPAAQAQYPLRLDLRTDKSVVIYGSSQTGKTQSLQTCLFTLLLSTMPEQLDVYIVENAGEEFEMFRAFPQVREIADSYSGAALVQHVEKLLEERLRRRGGREEKRIVLLVDNLNALMGSCKQSVRNLVQKGPGKGVHLLASALNSGDSVMSIQNDVGRGFCFWLSPNAYDYRDLIKDKSAFSIPPMDVPGRGIGRVESVVSFQTALLAEGGDPDRTALLVRTLAQRRWGDRPAKEAEPASGFAGQAAGNTGGRESGNGNGTLSRRGSVSGTVSEIGYGSVTGSASGSASGSSAGMEVTLGKKLDGFGDIVQDFSRSGSLLLVGDDVRSRSALLRAVGRQLVLRRPDAQLVGVSREETAWEGLPTLWRLKPGAELDAFLEQMSNELRARQTSGKTEAPPYVFLVEDIRDCLENASAVSRNRIDKNALLNAGRFGVCFVAGCSWEDYTALTDADEAEILRAGGAGKEVVPFRRLCAGRCLLLDCSPEACHPSLSRSYNIPERGNYYLGAGKAERIRL